MQSHPPAGHRPIRSLILLLLVGLALALATPLSTTAQYKSDDRAGDDGPGELGLVDNRTYVSPQHGYEVAWSRAWELDPYYEEPVVSVPHEEWDALYLAWEGEGDQSAFVTVDGQPSVREFDAQMDVWSDPEPGMWGEALDGEPILVDAGRDTGAVLYVLTDSEYDLAFYSLFVGIALDDDVLVLVTLTAYEDHFEAAYAAASDIEVEGDPLLTYFDWDEIEDAIERQ